MYALYGTVSSTTQCPAGVCTVAAHIPVALIVTVTYGLKVCGCNGEVAALQRCKCMQSYHLQVVIHVGGCNTCTRYKLVVMTQ